MVYVCQIHYHQLCDKTQAFCAYACILCGCFVEICMCHHLLHCMLHSSEQGLHVAQLSGLLFFKQLNEKIEYENSFYLIVGISL